MIHCYGTNDCVSREFEKKKKEVEGTEMLEITNAESMLSMQSYGLIYPRLK